MRRNTAYCLLTIFSILNSNCSEDKLSNHLESPATSTQQKIHEHALARLRLRNTGRLPLLVQEQPAPSPPPVLASYNDLPLEIRDLIMSFLDNPSLRVFAQIAWTENNLTERCMPTVLTPLLISQSILTKNQERYARISKLLIRFGAQAGRLCPYQIPLIARYFHSLAHLSIHGGCITGSLAQKLALSGTFKGLTRLSLAGSSFEAHAGKDIITCLAKASFASQLQAINFSRTGFSKTEGFALSQTNAFPALQELDISHNPACDIYVLSNIAYVLFTPHIEVLKIANTGLDQGCKLIPLRKKTVLLPDSLSEKSVPTFRSIRVLDVSHNALDDTSVKNNILEAAFTPKLTTLILANTGITALGLKYLAETKRLTSLKELDISNNPIGEILSLLASSVFVDKLRVLTITHVDAADQAVLSIIVRMPNLEELAISGNNKLTYTAITELIKKLPKLKKLVAYNLNLTKEERRVLRQQARVHALNMLL